MNCENYFCIYNFKNKCIVENISINIYGMCGDCIYPDIDKQILEDAKLKLLKDFED